MAERSVTVRISATDNFSTVVDQYKTKMGEAEGKTRTMGDASSTTKTRMDGLKTAIGGFVAGIALERVVNFGVEMTNLGRDVNLTRQRFDELVAPMGEAETIMQRLREASMGTASDQTLAEGSNLLMMTGVASSPEELERIIDLITRTKKPTDDLGTAIENFSLLLTNQSLLRLDSFGISSGRVRQRINELLEAGQALNREEAFKMAVMEEGAKLIDRLGESADAAATPLARLETNLENVKNQAASNIATGVEGTIGLLEIALGLHPEQQRRAEESARHVAENVQSAFTQAWGVGASQELSGEFTQSFINNVARLIEEDPTLANNIEELRLRAAQMLTPAEYNYPTASGQLAPLSTGRFDETLDPMVQITVQQRQLNDESREAAQIAEEQVAARERLNQFYATGKALIQGGLDTTKELVEGVTPHYLETQARLNGMYETGNDLLQGGVDLITEMIDKTAQHQQLEADRAASREMFARQLDDLERNAIDIGFGNFTGDAPFEDRLPDFMTREQADAIRAIADEAQAMADEMERMDGIDPGLFSDHKLEQMQDQAAAVGDLATEAEKAADAFDRISLSDIFGQTSGGAQGEINRMVLENFAGSDEQRAALERELNLGSGRETQGSLFLQEVLVPSIAEAGDDPELAAAMTSAVTDMLKEAALAGVDTNDPEFLAELQSQIGEVGLLGLDTEKLVTDFAATQGSLDKMAEDTPGIAEDMTTVSGDMQTSAEQSAQVADNTLQMAAMLGKARDEVTGIQSALAKLTSTVQKIRVQIEVDVTGDDIDGMVRKAVENNGGTAPGTVS